MHVRAIRGLSYAAILLLATSCTGGQEARATKTSSRSAADRGVAVRIVALPSRALANCTSVPDLRDACPSQVPAVQGPHNHSKAMRLSGFEVFQVAWSAPYPHLRRRNAPPRFVHLLVLGGDISQAFPFTFKAEADVPQSRSALVQANEHRAVSWGYVTWDGHRGILVLAPDYELGGMNGGHLVFRWTDAAGDHAISLHAWLPIAQAIATLRAIVASIPD